MRLKKDPAAAAAAVNSKAQPSPAKPKPKPTLQQPAAKPSILSPEEPGASEPPGSRKRIRRNLAPGDGESDDGSEYAPSGSDGEESDGYQPPKEAAAAAPARKAKKTAHGNRGGGGGGKRQIVDSDEDDDDDDDAPGDDDASGAADTAPVPKRKAASAPAASPPPAKKPAAAQLSAEAKPKAAAKPKALRPAAGGKASDRMLEQFGSLIVGSRDKKAKYTPLEQQFIDVKARFPDALLAVEVGYKYQFFGYDAEKASEVCNIVCYSKNAFKGASIPVHRLFVHVRRLVEHGYKVGIVQQTETAALKKAGKSGTKKSSTFTRDLTHMYTKGTLIGEELDAQHDLSGGASSNYVLALADEVNPAKPTEVTVSMLAVALGTGHMVYDCFEDGLDRSNLQTRLEHLEPTELLVPASGLSDRTETVVKHTCVTGVSPPRLERCAAESFAPLEDAEPGSSLESLKAKIPERVQRCLGALVAHLRDFGLTKVLDLAVHAVPFSNNASAMTLNGPTLRNLEIFRNATDANHKGSLFWVLNQTVTPFGGRHLREWVSRPLRDPAAIDRRLDAVQELCRGADEEFGSIKAVMAKLPDLERSLTNIFYGKCSPKLFVGLLQALGTVQDAFAQRQDMLASALEAGGTLLCLVEKIVAGLEDVSELLATIDAAAAANNDKVNLFVNDEGLDEVQELKRGIKDVDHRLGQHLREIRQEIGSPALNYKTVNGEPNLIELSKKGPANKRVPAGWMKVQGTKSVDRYRTPHTETLLDERGQLTEQLDAEAAAAWRDFLDRFSARYDAYRVVIAEIATLDALLSLGTVAKQPGFVRPTIVPDAEHTELKIVGGRNPVVAALLDGGSDFVANDGHLSNGPGGERCYIVTGPNMGGKSCYIRQVAHIAVLAQLGSFVPAESVTLTPLDAVYTRMGAEDDIFGKTSTFLHELTEASEILALASRRSLVIMDELGRGTSTHDGVAIAHATCRHLVEQLECLSLFVTHYPSISELAGALLDLGGRAIVGNFHMSFIEEEVAAEAAAEAEADDEAAEAAAAAAVASNITFLYKLVRGAAGRSYGLNVARLADIPQAILARAHQKSAELEAVVQKRRSESAPARFGRLIKAIDADDGAAVLAGLAALRAPVGGGTAF